MHLLGRNLGDNKPVRIALTKFYGMGHHLSERLIARLQIHRSCLVQDLTEPQITALSAYLSSTSTAERPNPTPLSTPELPPNCMKYTAPESSSSTGKARDPLDGLKIETDLKKSMRADIAHLREIGTYRGRRIAAGYPARGQRTKTNAGTAAKLNKLDRRRFSTAVVGSSSINSIPSFSSRPFASSHVLSALRSSPSAW